MEPLEGYITSGTNQARLLATIWRNEKFFLVAKQSQLQSEDFNVPACEMIYDVLLKYREKYGKMPSTGTLQNLVADTLKKEDETNETVIREVCNVLGIMTGDADTLLDYNYACDKLFDFIRTARIGRVAAANPNDVDRITSAVRDADNLVTRQRQQVSLLGDFETVLPRTTEEADVKIPTGITFLDFVTCGGLNTATNEIGLGMAGTGVGKTNMMINFSISAAFAGFEVLFITLELTSKEIMRRAIGMMAHVKAGEMRKPQDQWSEAAKARAQFLANSRLKDAIHIADLSNRSYSVSDLTAEIEAWKRATKSRAGTDEKCKLVIIDWLDMLVPEARDMKLVSQQWQALEKIGKDIKHMANNQNVAVWAVTQTNRQGAEAKKVRLDHVSGAYSKNFFGSLVIGLAPVDEDDSTKQISQNISKKDMQRMNTECNRTLHLNILKNRDGVQKESDIYQGPTLKFWRSKSEWTTTEKLLEGNDMKKIFGDGL